MTISLSKKKVAPHPPSTPGVTHVPQVQCHHPRNHAHQQFPREKFGRANPVVPVSATTRDHDDTRFSEVAEDESHNDCYSKVEEQQERPGDDDSSQRSGPVDTNSNDQDITDLEQGAILSSEHPDPTLIEARLVSRSVIDSEIPQAEIVAIDDTPKEESFIYKACMPTTTGSKLFCFGIVVLLACVLLIGIICGSGVCSDGGSNDLERSSLGEDILPTPPLANASGLPVNDDPMFDTQENAVQNDQEADETDPPSKFILDIPSYSILALQNATSSQSKAYKWLLTSSLQGMPEWRKQQLFALSTLFFSLDGDNWLQKDKQNWLDPSVSECKWTPDEQCPTCSTRYYQIMCSEQAQVTTLDLSYFGSDPTRGSLPPEIALLESLEMLELFDSHLEGQLEDFLPPTPQLASLGGHLEKLGLAQNKISGTVPTSLGLLTQLTSLQLLTNSVSGSLPSELALMTKLVRLDFEANELSGTIPTEFAALTSLDFVDLEMNQLFGAIPSQIGLLTKLTYLDFDNNELSATIPTELAALTRLAFLYMATNQLAGPIPSDLGLLTRLTSLLLHENWLQGRIPSELGVLTRLTGIGLRTNQLTGPIHQKLDY